MARLPDGTPGGPAPSDSGSVRGSVLCFGSDTTGGDFAPSASDPLVAALSSLGLPLSGSGVVGLEGIAGCIEVADPAGGSLGRHL